MTTRKLATSMAALLLPLIAHGYTLLNPTIKTTWNSSFVSYFINLGPYDDAASVALADWSQYTGSTRLLGFDVTGGSAWGNHRNDISWGSLPNSVLAWTLPNFDWTTGAMIETDIVFNSNYLWGNFDGSGNGYDIGRLLLHEIGHSIGLGHSTSGTIMNSYYQGNVWELTADDIAGARFLYPEETTRSVPESGNTAGLLALGLVTILFRKTNNKRTNQMSMFKTEWAGMPKRERKLMVGAWIAVTIGIVFLLWLFLGASPLKAQAPEGTERPPYGGSSAGADYARSIAGALSGESAFRDGFTKGLDAGLKIGSPDASRPGNGWTRAEAGGPLRPPSDLVAGSGATWGNGFAGQLGFTPGKYPGATECQF